MANQPVHKLSDLRRFLARDLNARHNVDCGLCLSPMQILLNKDWGCNIEDPEVRLEQVIWSAEEHYAVALPCGHILGASCLFQWNVAQARAANQRKVEFRCPWCQMKLTWPACKHPFVGLPIWVDNMNAIPSAPDNLRGRCSSCRIGRATNEMETFILSLDPKCDHMGTEDYYVYVDSEETPAHEPMPRGLEVWLRGMRCRELESNTEMKNFVRRKREELKRKAESWQDRDLVRRKYVLRLQRDEDTRPF